jgi:hydrogenase maturation protein HypF
VWPSAFLLDSKGHLVPYVTTEDAITKARALLLAGKIVAIKGIGGFHLACDAFNDGALSNEREKVSRRQTVRDYGGVD